MPVISFSAGFKRETRQVRNEHRTTKVSFRTSSTRPIKLNILTPRTEPVSLYSETSRRKPTETSKTTFRKRYNGCRHSRSRPCLSCFRMLPSIIRPPLLNGTGKLASPSGCLGMNRAVRASSFLPTISLRGQALSEVSARVKGRNVLVRSKRVVGRWRPAPTRRRVRQRRTEDG